MITQSINANLIPGQISPRVNVSQYDKKSRTLTFLLYKGSQPFNLESGMSVTIEGTKPDKTGFQYPMTSTVGFNIVSMSIEQQMTVLAGDVPCEIVVAGSGKRLASANFILAVEPAALRDDTVISETELPLIEEAAELAEHIGTYIVTIHEDALKAEGYATGKQNGVDVGSGSEYFHNNAKYYKEQAALIAQETVESLIMGEVVDNEPYVLRQGLGNLANMDLVGGSLVWNQLMDKSVYEATKTSYNVTVTKNNDGSVSLSGTSDSSGTVYAFNSISYSPSYWAKHAGHKVLFMPNITGTTDTKILVNYQGFNTDGIGIALNYQSSGIIIPISSDIASFNTVQIYVRVSESNANTNGTTIKPVAFDLTQMFGSTIADYIYSLEQATAGAGVAWFRKYFPNAYYGYQSGKIESVNVASRKVVGKNLLNIQLPSETKNGVTLKNNGDGTYTLTSTSSTSSGSFESTQTMELEVGTYIWRASLDGSSDIGGESIGYAYVNGLNGTTNWYRSYGSERHYKLIVTEKSTIKLGFSWYNATSALNVTFHPMIRLATVEDATYEPYKEYIYDFDSSVQLRGVPKLVDNKLSYDGDIWKADGSITRKYGIVDLGTLTWAITNNCFNSQNLSSNGAAKVNTSTGSANPIICAKYFTKATRATTVDYNNLEIGLSIASITEIIIKDTSYSDVATFKAAMSGVYAVYELATPTTESATAFQNPQRAFTNGTEEFVDAGVTAGTRDVSIPVGNNTTYQLNETLPPIEDYVDGAVKFKAAISALGTDESGRTTASKTYTAGEFFYKDGKMYKVLTSIAQGATFTINTNCQQTTLFAELKALAQ